MIGIADLLWFVAEKAGFTNGFTHFLDSYVKYESDARSILDYIVAMGTKMRLWKMAEVSRLGHPSLVSAARNYLRIETLHAANDALTNAIASLPMFRQYDIHDELHSSSDGQRIETQIEIINARHSRKYFGLKKGVSSYTLVANHVPINARIIGTHEHESHFVFDLLHSTSTCSDGSSSRKQGRASISMRLPSGTTTRTSGTERYETGDWTSKCISVR